MIIESQVLNKKKCILNFDEINKELYLEYYNENKKLIFSWQIFEGFGGDYVYNFYHDIDYDAEYLINFFSKYDIIAKRVRLFIIQNNIFKDTGTLYVDRVVSNQVYEWLMKDHELWR